MFDLQGTLLFTKLSITTTNKALARILGIRISIQSEPEDDLDYIDNKDNNINYNIKWFTVQQYISN